MRADLPSSDREHAARSLPPLPVRHFFDPYELIAVESRKGAVSEPKGTDPFPLPAHQTGRVHFEHPAFRLVSPQHPRERSPPHGAERRHRGFLASHCDTAGSKGHSSTRCCRLIVNHRSVSSFTSTPEARVLPSAGITQHRRYPDPLRLPDRPPSL